MKEGSIGWGGIFTFEKSIVLTLSQSVASIPYFEDLNHLKLINRIYLSPKFGKELLNSKFGVMVWHLS